MNIAHEAVDRHAAEARGDRVALRWLARDGTASEASYTQLRATTNQFANALRHLQIGPGDRVFTLLGRIPELYVTALGTLKNKSVLCPLFSAFGPEAIRQRIEHGDGPRARHNSRAVPPQGRPDPRPAARPPARRARRTDDRGR